MPSETFKMSTNSLEHEVDVVSRENEMLRADVKRLRAAFQNELRLNTDKSVKIAMLEAKVRGLTERLDVVSDDLDYQIGNRIFHEKRAERLAWFIEHMSEQVRELGNEADAKIISES